MGTEPGNIEFEDMFILSSYPIIYSSKKAHSYVTGIKDTFFISMLIFFVVSFKIAPKLMMEAYIFRFGKQSYPTNSIAYL
jgi:hypothetical protein